MAAFRSAPPSYSSVADSTKEVKLWKGSKERQKYEFMAELYALIMTIQHLEKAYLRDLIKHDVYEVQCSKLLAKYKTTERSLIADGTIKDLASFIREYRMDCKAAQLRIQMGVPDRGGPSNDGSQDHTQRVAKATMEFITLLDALKLDTRAVDDLQPLAADLWKTLGQMGGLLGKFDEQTKVESWLKTFSSMRASDELDDDQVRQFMFDLQNCYDVFMAKLKGDGT